ncbi:hypothetical protein ACXYMU_20290 [Pontibacter sp. CAU 1760]
MANVTQVFELKVSAPAVPQVDDCCLIRKAPYQLNKQMVALGYPESA